MYVFLDVLHEPQKVCHIFKEECQRGYLELQNNDTHFIFQLAQLIQEKTITTH